MVKNQFKTHMLKLKDSSGTHSPSMSTLLSEFPDVSIKIDACFLSNPYATDLFMSYFQRDLIDSGELRNLIEYYPSQNREIAKFISMAIGVDPGCILVGNGAIEVIQAVVHRFCKNKICVIIPTFSSYYEFVFPGIEVIFYPLCKSDDYRLDVDDYVKFVKHHMPDTVVIINPNNPTGGYVNQSDILFVLSQLGFVENIILDESFIHFAYENSKNDFVSNRSLISDFKNLIIVKSMSKDFGIAGLRAGYGVMSSDKVAELLSTGYLWNVSCLAEYFFKIYSSVDFLNRYEVVRTKFIETTDLFFSEMSSIEWVKTVPSRSNFLLVEIVDDKSMLDVFTDLLIDHGIYVRTCSDKIGLDGKYLRIASRKLDENKQIVNAFLEI